MFTNDVWPVEIPEESRRKAMESFHHHRIRELRTAERYRQSLDRLKEEYLQQLHSLIGQKNLKGYRRLHNARVKKMRDSYSEVRQEKERQALRKELVRESKKVIAKSGVDTAAILALQKSFQRKAAVLHGRTVGKGSIGRMVPRIKNTDYDPPYLMDAREYERYRSESDLNWPSHTLYFNGRTGDFGSRSRIRVRGADEWDLISATCRTGFMFVYHSTRAGLPVINLDLEAVDFRTYGYVDDECGVSHAYIRQTARLFGQVYAGTSPRRTYGPEPLISVHRRVREDYWDHTILSPGSDFGYYFTLNTPVEADQWVLIGVGVETFNEFLSNDCGVISEVEMRLLARRVGITTTT